MDLIDIDLEHNLEFLRCLYKYVSVKTSSNKVHKGWLKTIDPMTGSIILVEFEEDSSEIDHITLILRNAYENISEIKNVDPTIKSKLQQLYVGDTSHLEADIIGRKERLVSWIKKNRLPFRETDDGKALVVCENVTIHPPYNADACCSSNGRVLTMIRKLVDTVPPAETPSAEVKDVTALNKEKGDVKEASS